MFKRNVNINAETVPKFAPSYMDVAELKTYFTAVKDSTAILNPLFCVSYAEDLQTLIALLI